MSKYGLGLLRSARLTRRQLITFALVSAVLNGVVTACVGTWLAQTYATQQSRRKSVETLAHLIYDRRTRAGMVVSSLRRNALPEEIQYRKRAYDEAYVDWNKNILLNLFAIREVAGDLKFTTLVKAFEDELVASMADVDRCLTKAYDAKLAGQDPAPLLDACRMAMMHQFVLDCGATFTDELYKLTQIVVLAVLARAGGAQAARGDQHQGELHATAGSTAAHRYNHRAAGRTHYDGRANDHGDYLRCAGSAENTRGRACISAGGRAGDARRSEPRALSSV